MRLKTDRLGMPFTTRSAVEPLERRRLLAAATSSVVQLVDRASLSDELLAARADLFVGVDRVSGARNGATTHFEASRFAAFDLKLDALKSALETAPMEFTPEAATSALTLALPTPDGTFERFKVVDAPVFEKGLGEQFPEIRTFRGVGVDSPTASVRLDYTPLGFHAQVLDGAESFWIDPYYLNDVNGTYLSYHRQDLLHASSFDCEVHDTSPAASRATTDLASSDASILPETDADSPLTKIVSGNSAGAPLPITYGGTLKTYRTAVGTSYQYTAAVGGGTVAGGQAAIVTAINRVTGVYETELSIRLTLVANNSSLVYASSTGSFGNTSSVINTSTSKVNGIIGVGNYDVGHIFTTGSGGLAGLGVVGSSTQKAAGTTGSPSPTGDAFYIDYVAHEFGHQFGADHTFNTANDTGNRNGPTAYEPGSGVSIMAYAGLEGNDDLELHSIPYFHASSIDEIRTFIGTIPSVGTSTTVGNAAPTVSAGSNYAIPTGTPFMLTATGSDPNGDVLTYDWQQMDLGAANNLNSADNGASPLFRNYTPTTSPTRIFPQLTSVLRGWTYTPSYQGNATYKAERLPEVARSAMKFRVVARDNRAGGGGVSTSDMQLQVVNTGAAFSITSFNSVATLAGGSTQTIAWNVAGTTASPINAANVNIALSLDSGQTFPFLLASNTANDGSESVQIPFGISATGTARIRVMPTNNVFFDINNAALSVTLVNATSAVPGVPLLKAASDTGDSNSDRLTKLNNANAASVLLFDVPGTVAGATVELLVDGIAIGSAIATGTTTTVTTNGAVALPDGTRVFTARQTEVGKTVSAASASASVTIDTVAPYLGGPTAFAFETSHALKFTFAELLSTTSLPSTSFTLTRNGAPTSSAPTLTFDQSTLALTAAFPSILADGDYAVALSGAADLAGNVAGTTSPFSFFVLAGDANRDRVVNFDDLLVLAANYNTTGKTFSQANFSYDAAGNVDFDDLLILAANYNTGLPSATPAPLSAPGIGAPPAGRSDDDASAGPAGVLV